MSTFTISIWRPVRTAVMALLVVATVGVGALRADDFDTVRENWRVLLTGGSLYSTTDPDLAPKLGVSSVNSSWTSMNKAANRTYLWSDLANKSTTANITTGFKRLRAMALAYATAGTQLAGNASLRADIISGLDWMCANDYSEAIPAPRVGFLGQTALYTSDNWYDWQIGAPLALNDTVVLVYSALSSQQVATYMNAIKHFMAAPVPSEGGTSAGANLMWKCKVTALRGVLSKDATTVNSGISLLSNNLTSLFTFVTKSDGFYRDGSFIQHTAHPYTGGYGLALIVDVCDFLYLYQSAPFAVVDPERQNVVRWLRDAFDPVMFRGSLLAFVRGREISRGGTSDHSSGRDLTGAMLRAAQFAPAADAAYFRSVAKAWLLADTTFANRYDELSIYDTVLAKNAVNDAAVPARGDLRGFYHFGAMDRTVHQSGAWAAGLATSSTRIYNYESINSENTRGWHTGEGMLSLYNADLAQFSTTFWPTVDSQRLPGTTVEAGSTPAQSSKTGTAKVGGLRDFSGRTGVAAMDLSPPQGTLRGRKAWFFNDRRIVCLGAGLTATGGRTLETTVENRLLNATGSNGFSVNGAAQPAAVATSPASPVTLSAVRFAHLQGNLADGSADIGYFFPVASDLRAVREARSGAWSDINTTVIPTGGTVAATNRFLTLWHDHGVNPASASYAYAILPGVTAAAVNAYASAPDFTVLENSGAAQAIRETDTGAIAAVFWNAQSKTVGEGPEAITSDSVAIVSVRPVGAELQVSVAEPTQAAVKPVVIELGRRAFSVLEKSGSVTVLQLSPTILISVDATGLLGGTSYVRFAFDNSAATQAARLTNLSILTALGTPTDTLSMGYVVGGKDTSGTKTLVIRAAGPSLAALGVAGALNDPKLELFAGATKVVENDNWGGTSALANAMAAVGAFAYASPNSRDAAVVATVGAGDNSARVSAVGPGAGAVLAEIYDATPAAGFTVATPRLVNVSVLKHLGTGLTAGFVIGGVGGKTVLIRAIGPGLAAFGVSGTVPDPRLELFDGAAKSIAVNDNWGGTAALSAAFSAVGAFALAPASSDAALVATLQPGNYTVQVSGVGGVSGIALVEVYEVP